MVLKKFFALSVGTLFLCANTNVVAVKIRDHDARHEELELAQADADVDVAAQQEDPADDKQESHGVNLITNERNMNCLPQTQSKTDQMQPMPPMPPMPMQQNPMMLAQGMPMPMYNAQMGMAGMMNPAMANPMMANPMMANPYLG